MSDPCGEALILTQQAYTSPSMDQATSFVADVCFVCEKEPGHEVPHTAFGAFRRSNGEVTIWRMSWMPGSDRPA